MLYFVRFNPEGFMKSLFNYKLPITLFAVTALATAANAECERYKNCNFDVEVSAEPEVYAENVPQPKIQHNLALTAAAFGQNISFYASEYPTDNVNLTMDIYKPIEEGVSNRAAVIVAHGGSFVAGAKDDKDQKSIAYCDLLATRGFVAVSIDYRLGVTVQGDLPAPTPGATGIGALMPLLVSINQGATYNLTIDEVDYARAVYRGVQDINAAVRYLRANATKYGIDPERIYVLGNSAGAILAIENIYTNSKEDFPKESYEEKKNGDDIIRPGLGELNAFGVDDDYNGLCDNCDIDAHANGAVALWGATHNPKTLRYNKTPIFLAHGEADETVYFGTGKPMSNFDIMDLIPDEYVEMASSLLEGKLSLTIGAPVLYGSYVIDSALTANNGSKKKPETYFVEGQKHEFYNKEAYTEEVQSRVFDFLYKLATSDKVLHALAGVTIARANDNPDSVYAVIDGSYDGTDVVNIPSDINVASVSFNREFTPLRYSTMTLPFSVETDNVNGLEAVLRYNGIGKDKNGNDAVKMKVVWATGDWVIANDIRNAQNQLMEYGPTDLKANTPYLVQMNAKTFSVNSGINDPITLKETPTTETDVSADGWSFRGTWQYKKWKEGDPELGNAYGYAASPSDKIKVGDFVRVGEGAWITPMRAYLVKDNLQGVRANGAYAIRSSELPEIMSVIVDNDDANEEHTTVIGHFNTRTGEFRMNNAGARTYDLKGRYVGDKANKARGAYYGKKFLK